LVGQTGGRGAGRALFPDLETAVSYLRWLHGDTGPFSVGAIDPYDQDGLAWLTTRSLGEVRAFIGEQGARRRNLYFQPNTCRPDLGTARAGKGDVVLARVVHVDIDPPREHDGDVAALQRWQEAKRAELTAPLWGLHRGVSTPSAIVLSGSGYPVIWRLSPPVVLWTQAPDGTYYQDASLITAVEEANLGVLKVVDPAHAGTQNIDRLLNPPRPGVT
jgi:hypothetical protein